MKTTSKQSEENVVVWNFTDYREYLYNYVLLKRKSRRSFSPRQFCLRAGISTENYLLKIIRGERRLGPKLTESFIKALSLNEIDAQYFRCLTRLPLCSDTKERDFVLSQMDTLRRKAKRPIEIQDHSILRHWYLSTIWELASCKDIDINPHTVVASLKKSISLQEAKEAIEYLQRKGFLALQNGRLVQAETPLITSNGKTDVVLRIHHKEMVSAAIDCIDLPIEERGFFGLTIAVNQKQLPEIKARLKEFIDKLQDDLALDQEANTVYRINAHCFPLAEVKNE